MKHQVKLEKKNVSPGPRQESNLQPLKFKLDDFTIYARTMKRNVPKEIQLYTFSLYQILNYFFILNL